MIYTRLKNIFDGAKLEKTAKGHASNMSAFLADMWEKEGRLCAQTSYCYGHMTVCTAVGYLVSIARKAG